MRPNQLNTNMYNTQMDSGLGFNETMPEAILPFYQSLVCDPISAKASLNKDDSGLTYNVPAPRKRPRDPINDLDALSIVQKNKFSCLPSFVDENIIFQIQQQQSEIDRFIAEHVCYILYALSILISLFLFFFFFTLTLSGY